MISGLDNIIRLMNEAIKTVWCPGSETAFYGIAEPIEKDGQVYPACVNDGRAEFIIPDSKTEFKAFWTIQGDVSITETDDEYWGEMTDRQMSAPMSLVVVGDREMVRPECANSVRGLAASLVDALPTTAINAGTTLANVWIEDISLNTNTGQVLGAYYSGIDWQKHQVDVFGIELKFSLYVDQCDTICDTSPGQLCEDVTVKNSAGTTLGTPAAGNIFTVGDSTVSNSNDSYVYNLPATVDLELADNTVSNSDDSYLVSVPAQEDHELPDVTITVNDQDSNLLGAALVPAASDQTVVVTVSTSSYITFFLGNTVQTRLYQRMQFDGSFTAEYTPPGNISSYTVYINNVAQVGFPMAFSAGDDLYIEITETVPGGGATLRLTTDGITNPITISALDYFITRDMSYQENVVDYPNKYTDTDQSQQGNGNTTSYLTNFIGNTTMSGDWDLLIEPCEGTKTYSVSCIGVNDGTVSNTVANRHPRMAYYWFVNPIFTARCYEFGVSKLIMPNDNNVSLHWFKIEGRSGTVKYYKSTDNRATWTLIYTSLTPYTTQNYNADYVTLQGHYGIFKPARQVQQ